MTTYIESKLYPDGRTYDHSEVIEACHAGCEIEYIVHEIKGWRNVKESSPGYAVWFPKTKYRAVIEDKQSPIVDRCTKCGGAILPANPLLTGTCECVATEPAQTSASPSHGQKLTKYFRGY